MEQHASPEFYDIYHEHPDAFRVEHIKPGTQGSCVGLPRRNAPTAFKGEKVYQSGNYSNIYCRYGIWGYNFVHEKHRYQKFAYDSERAAARAHDLLVKARGMKRKLLLVEEVGA